MRNRQSELFITVIGLLCGLAAGDELDPYQDLIKDIFMIPPNEQQDTLMKPYGAIAEPPLNNGGYPPAPGPAPTPPTVAPPYRPPAPAPIGNNEVNVSDYFIFPNNPKMLTGTSSCSHAHMGNAFHTICAQMDQLLQTVKASSM